MGRSLGAGIAELGTQKTKPLRFLIHFPLAYMRAHRGFTQVWLVIYTHRCHWSSSARPYVRFYILHPISSVFKVIRHWCLTFWRKHLHYSLKKLIVWACTGWSTAVLYAHLQSAPTSFQYPIPMPASSAPPDRLPVFCGRLMMECHQLHAENRKINRQNRQNKHKNQSLEQSLCRIQMYVL